uniref:bis(5'-nucleosyl)-tetraphosphatase (symmetrical) YqeK n=1 Tax=Ndongobacter massiliensis TaxID=1871025 RepID=UPI000A4DAAFE|nr:bis(5'-nucleosyl)-tetraphosphatase (symmetrical) YqeK [Ndongobacter massiliensis]
MCEDVERLFEPVGEEDRAFLQEKPYNGWKNQLERDLSAHRYRHVLGVVKVAAALADYYGVDVEQARMAAFLHDCAKKNERAYYERLEKMGKLDGLSYERTPIFHAKIGSLAARWIFGVKEVSVCRAIAAHTTGCVGMDDLAKILFYADLVEPGRDFPGVEALREMAFDGLNAAVLAAMDRTLLHLLKAHCIIAVEGVQARNALLQEQKMENGVKEYENGNERTTEQ